MNGEEAAWLEIFSKLGVVGVLGGLALWFTRWLPKHFESEGARSDRLVAAFQAEMSEERESCDRRQERALAREDARMAQLLAHSDQNRALILSAIERKPS